MMDLNTTWFLLLFVLLAGYLILDGFDLGVAVLHLFARNERERRIHLSAVGPVWDGNEVWLLTAGGAMFAAFPVMYATVFSAFYLAFMLLLFALIFRAVSLEFRSQIEHAGWRRFWDGAFGFSSLVTAILLGVVMGNVLRGLPIAADGSLTIAFLALLNPYAILLGALSAAMLVMHGALYLAARTEGDLQQRTAHWASGAWVAFVTLYAAAMVATRFVSPFLFEGVLARPLFWIFVLGWLASVGWIPVMLKAGGFVRAFLLSSGAIASTMGLIAVSLFPRLVPSSVDLEYSLTIYNAASTPRTLTVMFVIVLVGIPAVLAYTAYVYKIFMGKVKLGAEGY